MIVTTNNERTTTMTTKTITITLTGDNESFSELTRILAEAAAKTESVMDEEALWDLHDRIAEAAE